MMKTYDGKRKENSGVSCWQSQQRQWTPAATEEEIVHADELCRLCLARTAALRHIFRHKEGGPPLTVRIMTCLQLEVIEGDGLPEMICHPCYFQLEKYYLFRKKCENSDQKLRKYLKKTTDVSDENTNEDEDVALKTEQDLVGSSITFVIPEDGEDAIDECLDSAQNKSISLPEEVQEDSRLQCTLKREILDEEYKYKDERAGNECSEPEIICNTEIQADDRMEAGCSDENLCVRVLPNNPGETTHVEVTTEDGSVLVMELTAEDDDMPTNEVEIDENGEFCILKCPDCPKAFARHAQLRRHSSMHVRQKGFTCEYCEKWFPSRSGLKKHERSHTGEKPFQCAVCDKCFTQKEILYRHLFTHSDKKPFNCTTCGKGFTQREALRTHALTHKSPRPALRVHKCPVCPKLFCHSSGLSRHLLIHAGKTYKCGSCEKSFNDKSTLRKHQKLTMHQDEP